MKEQTLESKSLARELMELHLKWKEQRDMRNEAIRKIKEQVNAEDNEVD